MAQISTTEQPHMKEIDLATLSIQQLGTLKQRVDQELEVFQESLTSLKSAQQKFMNSNETLKDINASCEGKEILVPLTGSFTFLLTLFLSILHKCVFRPRRKSVSKGIKNKMYVPGKLVDTNNVLIDIGTRYYVEKDISSAKDYFQRKTKFITEQMEKIQYLGLEKSKIRDAIVEIIQLKLNEQQKHA